MKNWLRRQGMLLLFLLLVGVTAVNLLWRSGNDLNLPAPAQESAKPAGQALAALLELGGGTAQRPRDYPDGELGVLSAPPWTKLEQADLAKLAEGYAGKAGYLAGLPPVEREKEREEALSGGDTSYFPYVYSGGLRLRGTYRALIEDADSGACYFRSEGERLGNFSVTDVRKDSLLLINEKTGKRIRLLKTAGK